MRSKKIFYIYIFITLFIGTSVQQFLNIDLNTDGVIANSHYLALPFLLVAFLFNNSIIRFTDLDKNLFVLLVIIGGFNALVLRKSVGFSGFLNFVIEPILLFSLLRVYNEDKSLKIKKIIVAFFIVECVIAIFEATTKNILFANVSGFVYENLFTDMRAYSLHGHPLQNAFLVSILSSVILSYKMKTIHRYALFFLGFLAVFSFNTRSSIYILSFIFILNVYHDIRNRKMKGWQKFLFVIGLLIVMFLVGNYIENHSLGSRLSTGLTADDSSSNARFVLVGIIKSMDLKDLLFGVSNSYVMNIMNKYELIAIENSIVNLIFGYGLIFTIMFFYFMYKYLKRIGTTQYMFYTTMLVAFLLLNANNALSTTCPIFSILILGLYAFREKPFLVSR